MTEIPMKIPIKLAILAVCIVLGNAAWTGVNALRHGASGVRTSAQEAQGEKKMTPKVQKTDREWKAELTPEQYAVMRQCGTEPAFSGKYNDFFQEGTYFCAACGIPLFGSETKYDHKTGWPSFTTPLDPSAVEYRDDDSHGMHRVEVRCAVCGAHLGHVFDDGPAPTGRHYCINSAAMNFVPAGASKPPAPTKTSEVATFAAGCFWGVEYKFGQVKGVLDTTVGYTGGATGQPTYEEVCTGQTGHAESVRVTFDSSVVSYEDLVRKFFSFHDPTQVDRQGPDFGTQYRSVIFYHSEEQKRTAERVKSDLEASKTLRNRVATEIVRAHEFFKAEEYHQKYYQKNKIKSCIF